MSAITKRACGQRPRARCNMAGEESIPVIAGRSFGNLGSLDKSARPANRLQSDLSPGLLDSATKRAE